MADAIESYILEQTYDKLGWVAACSDGSMVITWDNMNFMKTINVMFSDVPDTEIDRQEHLAKMEVLVEWLSEYHFEKMYR